MKKWSLFWTSVVMVFSFSAHADFGLGVILGAPTGLSGIYKMSNAHAIDAALAWDLDDDHVHLHGTYLWWKPRGLTLDKVSLDWYWGIGARLVILDKDNRRRWDDDYDDDYYFGPRAPIGVSYTFADPRIELFGELALILNLIEDTDIDLDGGIGARFHF